MPPLTNKDTPPVHCNEYNYMYSSSTYNRFSACKILQALDLLYVLSITPDTWHFFYNCAFERSVRTFVQRSVRTFVQRSVRTFVQRSVRRFVQRSVRTFVQRSVRTLRISILIAVRKVVDLRSPDPMAKRQLTRPLLCMCQ